MPNRGRPGGRDRVGRADGCVVGVAIFSRDWGSTVWPDSQLTYMTPVVLADRVIRWSTGLAVPGVAAVAAVVSYEHASELVRAHGESGWTGRLIPLTVDGLVYASSTVMLDSARQSAPVPVLARWLLSVGIAATLAANVAHGLGHGVVGAAVGTGHPCCATCGSATRTVPARLPRRTRQPE